MSEGPAPVTHWFQFSLRTLFISVTALAISIGLAIGGLRWLASQVIEIETQWRRDSVAAGKWDELKDADIDSLLNGWFDEREIKSMKDRIQRRRIKDTSSSPVP